MRDKIYTAYNKVSTFLVKPFFAEQRTTMVLWVILALLGMTKLHHDNNFKVFRGVFWHTLHQTSLFAAYPQEHFD